MFHKNSRRTKSFEAEVKIASELGYKSVVS